MRSSRRLLAVFGVFAIGLTGAAAAWACSPNAAISTTVQPAAAAPGTTVTLNGVRFMPNGEVVIKLVSEKVPPTETILATEIGPDFTVGLRIPNVSPGPYVIVATGYKENRPLNPEPAGQTQMKFEVRPSQTVASTDPATGTDPAGQTRNRISGGSSAQPANQPATVQAPVASPEAASTGAPSSDAAVQAPAASSPASRSTAAPSPAAAPRASLAPASANPAAVAMPSGSVVFGGSVATPVADEETAVPGGTATDDLWSGFTQGIRTSPLNSESGTTPGADGSPLAIGLLLVGGAVVALSAGFAVAETGRRRALARGFRRLD